MINAVFDYIMDFSIVQYVVGCGLIIFPLIIIARIYSFIKSKISGTVDEYKEIGYIFPKWKLLSWTVFLLIFVLDDGESVKNLVLELITVLYFIIAEIKDYKIRKSLEEIAERSKSWKF